VSDLAPVGAETNAMESERQLLGAILLRPSVLDDLALDPQRFYRPAHQLIAEHVDAMHARREPIDPVSVGDRIIRAGARVEPVLLHELVGGCHTATNAAWHWQRVSEAWARRTVAETAHGIALKAAQHTGDPLELVTAARADLADVAARVTGAGEASLLQDGISEVIETLTRPTSLTATGWTDLDRVIGGWRPGAVHVVAARPGKGKSLLALNAAMRVAGGAPALFHSLEMPRREIQLRAIANLARVGSERFHRGSDLTEAEWGRVSKAWTRMSEMTLIVDDRAAVTAADIHSRARSVKDRYGSLGLVVVDYLQLVRPSTGRRDETRQEQVASVSRALKLLAMDLEVPVIACAQLNRQSEQRGDGKPRLSDLRESGAVEQDADCVLLLHRDDDPEVNPGELEVHVAKNRAGATGPLSLMWAPWVSRIDNLGRHLEAV
jgi:replicative DNA helicase